jgi:hypothetical protein
MQDKFNKEIPSPSDEVTPEFREALAVYFERLNGAEVSGEAVALLSTMKAQPAADWARVEALLEVPDRLDRQTPDVDRAWQSFQQRAFSGLAETQAASLSLGRYVSEALARNETSAIVESGLPKATLEAIQSDATSLDDLKGYQLNDYADLARRYGVKDSAFPRMLRWLKGLGKSFTFPALGQSGGLVFAREEEVRKQGLNEAELAEQLEKADDTEKSN